MINTSTKSSMHLLWALKKRAVYAILLVALLPFSQTAFATTPVKKPKFLAKPPGAITSFAPTSGAIGTVVTVKGTGLAGATSVVIGGKAAIIVSSSDNTIVAMVMPGSITGLVKVTTPGGTTTGGDFTVTATVYPTQQLGNKFVDTTTYPNLTYQKMASVTPQNSPFAYRYKNVKQGNVVALSADGNSAIALASVGLNYEADLTFSPGALTFYEKHGGAWNKSGQYFPERYLPLLWGKNALLNANGTVAVVVNSDFVYPVEVFEKQNGVWQKSVHDFGVGGSAAVSADGNTIVIGNQYVRLVGGRGGGLIVYEATTVYRRIDGNWIKDALAGPVPPANVSGPTFQGTVDFGEGKIAGENVALSADGKILAATSYNGGTYIMQRDGNNWELLQRLDVRSGRVHLNADGNILLQQSLNLQSASDIYVRTGNSWTKAQTFTDAGPATMSAGGNVLLFGNSGGSVVYVRNNEGTWIKRNGSLSTTPAVSVAISADGTGALTGFPEDASLGTPRNNVYTYNQIRNSDGSVTIDTSTVTNPYGSITAFSNAVIPATPTGFATALTFSNTTNNSTTLSWTKGNGSVRAVFIKQGSNGFPSPLDGVTYTAASTFAAGTQVGTTGWYCVYNGNGSTVNITALLDGTTYKGAVVEYNGQAGVEKYLISTGAPASVTTLKLAPAVQASAVAFTGTTSIATTVSWINGSGTGRAVFMNMTDSGVPLPADVYYSSNNRYHSGNQISSTGWYCIYNGTGSMVNVVGLTSGAKYRVAVAEYSGTAAAPKYLTTGITPANVTTPIAAPTGYAVALAFSNTSATATTLSWASGNGAARAVFLKMGTSGALNVVDGTTYNSGAFAAGTPAGTNGWYCVYNGTGNTVAITGLTASTTYRAVVIEYNGSGATSAYNLSRYNVANVTTTAAPFMLLTTTQKQMLVEQDMIADETLGDVIVHPGISPNSDGVNDIFNIEGITAYPENTVQVMNSNGELIYSVKGYNNSSNAFDGHAANGKLQKAGTYFYSIEYKKGAEVVRKTGYLVIKY